MGFLEHVQKIVIRSFSFLNSLNFTQNSIQKKLPQGMLYSGAFLGKYLKFCLKKKFIKKWQPCIFTENAEEVVIMVHFLIL